MTRRPEHLESVRYLEGDLLRAGGLDAAAASRDELRWWHNRACHRPYGIAFGLEASLGTTADGRVGVTAQKGLAYDAYGRELILAAPATIAAPDDLAEAEIVELALTAPEARDAGGRPETPWPCEAGAPAPSAGLVWMRGRAGRRIDPVLARLTRSGETVRLDEDFRPFRSRGMRRPRIARGETSQLSTNWERWTVAITDADGVLRLVVAGVQTRIDTRAAGFSGDPEAGAAPVYLASANWPAEAQKSPLAVFGHVADATADGFTYRLLLWGIARRDVRVATAFARVRSIGEDRREVGTRGGAGFLARADAVTRLLPVAARAIRVEEVSGSSVTLAAALKLEAKTTLGAFRRPGFARAMGISAARVSLDLTNGADLSAGDVLVRPGDPPPFAVPVEIASVFGSTVTLATAATAWRRNMVLFRLADAALVVSVEGGTVTLDQRASVAAGDVVYFAPDGEAEQAARLASVEGATLTLAAGSATPKVGARLRLPEGEFRIRRVVPAAVTLEVDDASPFRAADGIATAKGAWALVTAVNGTVLSLSRPLDGVDAGDAVARMMVSGRTSVVEIAADGVTMRVGSTLGLAVGQPVAALVDDVRQDLGAVELIVGDRVRLNQRLPIAPGAVVVSLRPPAAGRATFVSADGRDVMLEGGVVGPTALLCAAEAGSTACATVRSVTDGTIRLDRELGVGVGDAVCELEVLAPFEASPSDSGDELVVDDPGDLRPSDVVGVVERWVSRAEDRPVASARDGMLSLQDPLDGLVAGDMLGLADLSLQRPVLRLADVEGVAEGDALTLSGVDARTGETRLAPAFVSSVAHDLGLVALRLDGLAEGDRLRPESVRLGFDYNARVADTFPADARRDGLFVSWLGVERGDVDLATAPEG
ncbi:hypothetical protein DA075_19260 [Methylobacterium currus]|uniref:Uncharacterized protein n=1 Tax=Methylobacterium currus TaxID=2051553 RepID=A0A2R4WMK5_9HYPH|nr:hypothetical protein [Methylobacterium currus]AWB22782.1 hypothetical protein DA075_19260 [Methylobacterium currus]